MAFIIDSHCHLDFDELNSDLPQILQNAKDNQVNYLQTICTKISEFSKIQNIAKNHSNIFCSVGVHPSNVEQEGIHKAEEIIDLSRGEKVIGIGETGLDYFYENSLRDLQIESFKEHIKASQETGLPVIIHSRDAEEDSYDIIKQTQQEKPYPALIHCFTASQDFADKMLELGLYISISGIVTFKKATELQEIVKNLPLDRILVETDAPYLAPVPKRGKINQPAFTKYTAEFVAELKGVSYDQLAQVTSGNFFKLFSKANIKSDFK